MTHREVITWARSSHSGGGANGANCIEAGIGHRHMVGIRDSKMVAAESFPMLTLNPANWESFLTDIKQGRFDDRG